MNSDIIKVLVRSSLFTIFSIAILSVASVAKTHKVTTSWVDHEFSIDGNMKEWFDVESKYLSDQEASVSICNDEKFLYILFKTREAKWARTIKMTGLNLYINKDGKNKKDFFIRFKGGPNSDQLKAMAGGMNERESRAFRESRMPAEMRKKYEQTMNDNTQTLICSINDNVNKVVPLDGAEGPAAAFDTSNGFFVYEFKIPLDKGKDRYYGIGIEPGHKIAIGAEWGDMGDFRRRQAGEFGGGQMPGGGGRPPGGGGGFDGGRRRMGGDGGNRPKMPTKQEVWFKTKIAVKVAAETSK